MGTKEQLTERIRLMTERCRLAWLTVLAATTGTVGLLLGELSTKRLFFAVFGVVAIAWFRDSSRLSDLADHSHY